MKKAITALICAFAVVVAVSMLRSTGDYSRTEYMLSTMITITADDKSAVDKSFDEIGRIEKLLSAYTEDSEVSKINSAPAGTPVKVGRETFGLIETAVNIKMLTGGAFDITVKPLVDLWNISNGGYVPTAEEIAGGVSLVGDIILDKSNLTVTLPKDGMRIDLGGIAKGYAGDRVRAVLEGEGVKSAIADLGGNIVAIGKKGKDVWKVGLQSPGDSRGTIFATVSAADTCVVTSGGYERYFESDGKTYHHIIDPRTGLNPTNDILSVTVISPNGTVADALSTAFFVLGRDRAAEVAEALGVDVVIYTREEVFATDGLTIEYSRE